MVSKRNFFAITIIMAITFFLFQFVNIAKDRWNDYETNSYAEDRNTLADKDSAYEVEGTSVVYIGKEQQDRIGNVAADWAHYMKKGFAYYVSLAELEAVLPDDGEGKPQIVVIDPDAVNWKDTQETRRLQNLAEEGINLVFGKLPDVKILKENKELCDLLGIRKIKKERTTVKGLHVYEGFLLGGEKIYQAETKQEKKNQDMELTFPWFQLESGTKVYMKGIPKDKTLKEEAYPVVIWRNSFEKASVFAVNGNYMEDATGLGLLTGMLCEMSDYAIYPVVNAQNLVIANYPGFAEENDAVMEKMYSQSVRGVFRDIIWPSVNAIHEKNNMGLSFMLSPQLDYSDKKEPVGKDLRYYLKEINEARAEAGLSADMVSDTDIRKKLAEDEKFVRSEMPEFQFASFYQGKLSEKELAKALEQPVLQNVCTVIKAQDDQSNLLDYENENVTGQRVVSDGFSHTYSEDFRIKSIETALGYSSVLADMSQIVYPESEKDGWEKFSEKLSANISTYWKDFQGFDGTTVSECDKRIRNFLSLFYREERKNNIIMLEKEGTDEPAWFILRIHNEEIEKMGGGSYKKLEEGVWLIQADSNNVILNLKSSETQKYY